MAYSPTPNYAYPTVNDPRGSALADYGLSGASSLNNAACQQKATYADSYQTACVAERQGLTTTVEEIEKLVQENHQMVIRLSEILDNTYLSCGTTIGACPPPVSQHLQSSLAVSGDKLRQANARLTDVLGFVCR